MTGIWTNRGDGWELDVPQTSKVAPDSVESVRQALAQTRFDQGVSVNSNTPEVLEVLTAAYEVAAGA